LLAISAESYLKDKFYILHLKPCFKVVSEEIELRLKFGQIAAEDAFQQVYS